MSKVVIRREEPTVDRAGTIRHVISHASRVVKKSLKKVSKRIYNKEKPKHRILKVIKKEPKLNLDAGHSGIGRDTFKINAGEVHLLKKQSMGGTWKYQQTHKGVLTSTPGNQGVYDLFSVGSSQQCSINTGTSYNGYQNEIGLKNMNPYTNTTGGNYLSAITPLDDRFVIKQYSVNFEMTNFSSVGTIADVYLVKAKKLGNIKPQQAWDSGNQQLAEGQGAMTQPATGVFSGTVGYLVSYVVGVRPSSSPVFKSYWAVECCKTVTLAPAATEILNFDIAVNKVVKNVDLTAEAAAGTLYRPSTTYAFMVVVRGALVLDNTQLGGVANTTPTYGPVKLGYIATAHTQCAAVKGGNANRLSVNVGYSGVPQGAANANMSLLNEVDNVVQPTV